MKHLSALQYPQATVAWDGQQRVVNELITLKKKQPVRAIRSTLWVGMVTNRDTGQKVYRSLNGTAPRYLAADLRRLSDMPSRRRLRSSLTDQLDVRQSQCSTVGDRAFAVAGCSTMEQSAT